MEIVIVIASVLVILCVIKLFINSMRKESGKINYMKMKFNTKVAILHDLTFLHYVRGIAKSLLHLYCFCKNIEIVKIGLSLYLYNLHEKKIY